MSTTKETANDQDPDYIQPISTDENQQKIYEENARTNTARKITAIIEKEFSQEIDTKEKEVLQIQEKLHKALKTLHLLRYVIITDFYNRKKCQAPQTAETKQTRIHPAVKQLLGKSPKGFHSDLAIPSTSTDPRFLNGCDYPSTSAASETTSINNVSSESTKRSETATENPSLSRSEKRSLEDDGSRPRKIPRYVPPKSGVPDPPCPSRGIRHKVRKRIVVGNISKWIPPDWREDAASHKWTMYVRGSKEDADIGEFVNKVRFFLHPSYRPNDVVEVTSAPFHLSRRGWGEFPLRVQLHFKSPLNKPMDIIHHLKLDRTYTGLQTLGSETLVDVWIYTTEPRTLGKSDVEIEEEPVTKVSSSLSIPMTQKSKDVAKEKEKEKENTAALPKIEKFDIEVSNNNAIPSIEIESIRIKKEPEEEPDSSSINSSDSKQVDSKLPIQSDLKSVNLENLRRSIRLDHDYLSHQSHDENNQVIEENNVTIHHSPKKGDAQIQNIPESRNNIIEHDSITETKHNINHKEEKMQISINTTVPTEQNANKASGVASTNPSIHRGNNTSTSLIAQQILKTDLLKNGISCASSTTSNRDNTQPRQNTIATDPQKSSIGPMPNLRPLQISIPPPFEPTSGKCVLLLKNDKLISVDIANANHTDTSANTKLKVPLSSANQLKPKTIVSIGRGISLLKKSQTDPNRTKPNPTSENATNDGAKFLKIKPSGSLLLNVNYNIPALKIADGYTRNVKNGPASKEIKSENLEEKPAKPKITLGKDKYKIQSKKDLYKETLNSIDLANIADAEGLLRFIVRRIPIITEHASDPEYKQLHPYACLDEKEFFSHNVGKQRAFEWYRAKQIRSYMRQKLPEDKLWSVKEIMIWARLHGYTPVCTSFGIGKSITSKGAKKLPGSMSSGSISTCTEPVAFEKWLQSSREKSENGSSIDQWHSEEIDIVRVVDESTKNVRRKSSDDEHRLSNSSKVIPLEFDEKLIPLHDFVCETARDIGIKLGPEEIVPNVIHCAAGRMLTRVLECLVEDLVRSSFAKAWERSDENVCPKLLTIDDVRSAIASREEFDIFTNEGLGSRQSAATN